MIVGQTLREEVRRACAGLSGGALAVVVQDYAAKLECHPSTLYRWLAVPTQRRQRQVRSDRGQGKLGLSPETWQRLSHYCVRYDMAAQDAIEHGLQEGLFAAEGAPSVATLNRYLHSQGVSVADRKRDIKVHRRFEAKQANDLHQMDLTEIPMYFVEPDGSIGYDRVLPNKKSKQSSKPRLHLFTLTDDHSRVKFGELFIGKNALNWVDFLMHAWEQKADPQFPFCGRPNKLYVDNDSAVKAQVFIDFMAFMEVEVLCHEVEKPWSKGKVERAIGVIKKKLIALLKVQLDNGRRLTLAQANELLYDLLFKLNYRKHATTQEMPMPRWYASMGQRPPRLMPSPEMRDRFYYTAKEVRINADLSVRIGDPRGPWQLPRQEPFFSWAGRTVPVYFNPGRLDYLVVVVDEREYRVEYLAPEVHAAGEYRATAESDTQQMLDALNRPREEKIIGGGFYRQLYTGDAAFFPQTGEAYQEERAALVPQRPLTITEATMRLRAAGLKCSIADVQAYCGNKELSEDEYPALLEHFQHVPATQRSASA